MSGIVNERPHISSSAIHSRRLIPHIIDDLAKKDPEREAFSIPRSSDPKHGWRAVSFREYANAINRVAHWIIETCGTPREGTFPTIAYIGLNDARYVVLLVGAVKAGYKVLLISPRNSQEGQLSLFDKTDCNIIAFAKPLRSWIQPWLQERDMKAIEVGHIDTWFPKKDVKPFPYHKTFEQAEWEPLMVLHTSGSTGIPKPIVICHGLVAINDAIRNTQDPEGVTSWMRGFVKSSKKHFLPMPLFHAAAMYVFISFSIYWNIPMAFVNGDRLLSTDLVAECLEYADVESAILPPAILEAMSHNEDHIRLLAKLNIVTFGGATLNKKAGDRLVEKGVTLINTIGTTEYALLPMQFQENRSLWQYFIFKSDLIGADWRKVDGTEDVYRLVIVRKDKHPGLQGIFYTFPNADEYDTNDMFKSHPTLPNHWLYHGRSDNIVVFSNGEKLNPIDIEEAITDHPGVRGVVVVGSNRFQPGLIIEPVTHPKNDEEAEKLIDGIWPYVVNTNKETVAHGQIGREFIMLSSPDKPFPRAGKGTVQRAGTIKLYHDEIDTLYERAGTVFEVEAPSIDASSEDALVESIREIFQTKLGVKGDLEEGTDFFSVGIDSLQVINASRLLRAGLQAAGSHIDSTALATRAIYSNPTPRKLARYLYSAMQEEGKSSIESAGQPEILAMEALWKKYTTDLPEKKEGRPDPNDTEQTVLLTGTTGMLGSYMLDIMVNDPKVKKIICLNRAEDGGIRQQADAAKERGLNNNYTSKAEFFHVDMSRSGFGLPAEVYTRLLEEADRIVHNAWPVNFNMPVVSFEPNIRSVRNIADFASVSSKRVAVVFVSSISTVDHWDSNAGPVPEARIEDLGLAGMGYGRSKTIGSLILEDVAKAGDFPAAVIRVGQIAGPAAELGCWNRHEWLPSIVASSLYLNALPAHLGMMQRVDWTPAEGIANLVLEVAGVTRMVSADDITGYYHGVNPSSTTWTDIAPAVQEFYGKGRIRELLPTFGEWIDRLEKSYSGDTRALDKNPGVKLIDSYRGMSGAYEAGKKPLILDMTRTTQRSPTMKSVTAVTPELMKHWCKQWGF
ncbi:acetyl-CoA synthetase-like protein [Hypoxylon sp. FL1150]|nr:acetyl-CoA synthetase-like protein [Hypoxylon sp. FL1150]